MLKINNIPQTIKCPNCNKPLHGKAVTVTENNDTKQTTIILCPDCLIKAADILKEEKQKEKNRLPKKIRHLAEQIIKGKFDYETHRETG